MLSILKEITLQKEWHILCVTNNAFLDKTVKTQ